MTGDSSVSVYTRLSLLAIGIYPGKEVSKNKRNPLIFATTTCHEKGRRLFDSRAPKA